MLYRIFMNFSTIASYAPGDVNSTFVLITLIIVLAVVVLCALTKNGLFAIAVGIVAELALIVCGFVNSTLLENLVPNLLSELSLFGRFSPFIEGVYDLNAIVLYLAVCAVFVFLTINSFEKRRWN